MGGTFDPLLGQLRTSDATPDATDTVKGKLKLTNDLGGTADQPTTPTAVHITGDESADGEKNWNGNQYFNANTTTAGKTYRNGGLAIYGAYLGAVNLYGTNQAAFNNVSAKSSFIYQDNAVVSTVTAPMYARNLTTNEIFSVGGKAGFIWDGCVRGLFGTTPAPITVGDLLECYYTGASATFMSGTEAERLTIDYSGQAGVAEIILPDYNSVTIDDGQVYEIGDFGGTLTYGSGLIITDPNGESVQVWDTSAYVSCIFDASYGKWSFLKTASPESVGNTPDKYAVRAATTASIGTAYNPSTQSLVTSSFTSCDGISLQAGDIILVKNESTASRNGVYVYTGSSASIRIAEFSASSQFVPATVFYVSEGTVNANSTWVLTTDDPITLDTTSLEFKRTDYTYDEIIPSYDILIPTNRTNVRFGEIELLSTRELTIEGTGDFAIL